MPIDYLLFFGTCLLSLMPGVSLYEIKLLDLQRGQQSIFSSTDFLWAFQQRAQCLLIKEQISSQCTVCAFVSINMSCCCVLGCGSLLPASDGHDT